MTLQLNGPISLANICAEFGLNPATAVFPRDFYGKGGAPSSGELKFSDFYGRSAAVSQGFNRGNMTTSFVVATYADLQITSTGAAAAVSLVGYIDHAADGTNGGVTGEVKVERKIGAGGAWTQIGVTQAASTGEPIVDVETQQRDYVRGPINYTFTDAHGQAAGVAIFYRVPARKSAGSKAAQASGTLTVTP